MKILSVSDVYFPRVNGVSTSIATFHREYERRGHATTLVAPAYPPDHGGVDAPADGPRVISVPSRRVPFDPEDRMMRATDARRLEPALRAEGYDVLHVQTPFVAHGVGLHLGRALGIPVVETYHTYFEEYLFHYVPVVPRALLRLLARRFSRRQCEEVDAIVVPSPAMEETLRSYGVKGRIERIPTGLRLDELQGGDGDAFRRRQGIAPGRPTLVHVGRVAFEKNIDFLLRVLERVRQDVPDVLLVVAGEGPARPALEAETRELGLGDSVRFVGYLDRRRELLDCYRAGDAFVFASRTETQGLVLLEAMATGVPVVSTAVMGTRDVLASGKGALVAEDDLEDFTSKVTRLLRDPVLRRRLADEARIEVARRWRAEATAERMLDLYAELVAERSRHGLRRVA